MNSKLSQCLKRRYLGGHQYCFGSRRRHNSEILFFSSDNEEQHRKIRGPKPQSFSFSSTATTKRRRDSTCTLTSNSGGTRVISTKPPAVTNNTIHAARAASASKFIRSCKRLKVWEVPVGTDTADLRGVGTLYVFKRGGEEMEWEQVPKEILHQNQALSKKSNAAYNLSFSEILDHYILKHFLPMDYPKSVERGYTTYATYCFLGNTCGSAAMVLSTQTLLLAVGVGSASAAPMAGALNWVMKDGIGQLGGVLFASRITSNTTGDTIDKDPKRWRMVSSMSMDAATLLEILSPLFPGHFLAVASVANIGKNISFLTASASRAALHQSLATENNLGDVTAKAGSQSIAASLMGTGLGIGLSPLIGGDYFCITAGFICLSCVHQYCIFKSLKAVALKKLNKHRLNIALGLFFHSFPVEDEAGEGEERNFDNVSLSPSAISRYENFIPFISSDNSQKWLQIGCSVIEMAPQPQELPNLVSVCLRNKERYLLNCEIEGMGNDLICLRKVMITFHHDAKDDDILRGLFHAHVIKVLSANNFVQLDIHKENVNQSAAEIKRQIINISYEVMAKQIDSFLFNLKKSWEIKGESIRLESSKGFRFYLYQ